MTSSLSSRSPARTWILVGIGGAVALGLATFLIRTQPWRTQDWRKMPEGPARDKLALVDPKARPVDLFGSMIRLAKQADPLARVTALKQIKNIDSLVREGAALALGHYEDQEAVAALGEALLDPVESVRIKAIEGFSLKKTAARLTQLKSRLKPEQSVLEALSLRSALIRIADQPEQKQEHLAWIAEQLSAQRLTKSLPIPTLTQLLIQAISLGATDPGIHRSLRGFAKDDRGSGLQAMVIRHLAAHQDPWIRTELSGLVSHPSREVRLAVAEAIKSVCPSSRFDLLERLFKSEGDGGFRVRVIKEIGSMPSSGALVLLQKLKKGAIGPELETLSTFEKVTASRNQPGSDPCGKALSKK